MKTNELRQTFLNYFKEHGHHILPGSSLIPANDPTLLFTNAGMVQFKDYFLGREAAPFPRITTAQPCVRAGGKHNDLDNVGYTARHHTFFEMLGNFSFNAYFKKEAIELAWGFLTKALKIPAEKLWVTVHTGDDESADLWLKHMGVDPTRFSRCGEDNFWSMGDTGPCGPCTEIFYDHGPEIPGGPPGSPDGDADRYIEIWNLVFMQFNRAADGSLTPLPNPCVDTGMGFERMAAVLQGVHNNYEIDLFQHLLKSLSEIIHYSNTKDTSMQVIVDHIRSASFLILDGVLPGNEARSYVLRRIIRRALRHGHRLNQTEPFFYKLVSALAEVMGEAYPRLIKEKKKIEEVLLQEELQFALTLSKGMKLFEQAVAQLKTKTIPGEIVFQLYDTYGFPPDLTADIARERDLSIDEAGFDTCMSKQRQQSQQANQFGVDYNASVDFKIPTQFLGYETTQAEAKVLALISEKAENTHELKAGEKAIVILDKTPFYAESGGQIGDKGHLESAGAYFEVIDTQKQGEVYLHQGLLIRGHLKVGDLLQAKLSDARQAIRLNHSATHLLHAALKTILGEHVSQKGSLVQAERLRFDFTHPKALSDEQLKALEHLVNEQIRANFAVDTNEMELEKAKAAGAQALFGEKYGATVRVVSMGDFSSELCGGTHVTRSGDIGLFKIIAESASAAGIRRIEAVTGAAALSWLEASESNLCQELNLAQERSRLLEKQITQLKQKLVNEQFDQLVAGAQQFNSYSVLAANLGEIELEFLRNMLDRLRQALGHSAIILAAVLNNKVQLVAGVSPEMLPFFNATELLNQVAKPLGGKGGGRPELAQGGAEDPQNLSVALDSVYQWAQQKIQVA